MNALLQVTTFAIVSLTAASHAWLAATVPAAERCLDIVADGSGPLGNVDGAVGSAPIAVTFGNVRGTLSSSVTSYGSSTINGELIPHLTVLRTFVSAVSERAGALIMQERAVCLPATSSATVCRANDALTIVSGTGIFANAAGSLRNHGMIEFNTFSLTFSIRGRVCGDALSAND